MNESLPLAVVTGGTGAIGGAIARGLVERGFRVLIVAREPQRGKVAKRKVGADFPGRVSVEIADLSSPQEIFQLAARVTDPVRVLVNNAAECPRRRQVTLDGIERQFATNVLGYHFMIEAFQPSLERAAPARVVNVASYWAGDLDMDDLQFRRRTYDNDLAYRQSKQADRILSAGWARRLEHVGVTVNSCHPGDVRSRLSADLGFGGHETPEQAAETPVWLATGGEGGARTGGYFAHRQEEPCRFSADLALNERLLETCARYRAESPP
jgi:NAD(P)-dependent dehydrogenase (short-subunit alcohol dehydrogenase family)